MKVTLESTTRLIDLQTPSGVVPARLWEGTTDSGIPVTAYITRIQVAADEDQTQFAAELQACRPPTLQGAIIPLRFIL